MSRFVIMYKQFLNILFLAAAITSHNSPCFCQKNAPSPWDSSLESNSDKWKLVTHQKMFSGDNKLEFGPYTLVSMEKLDSPTHKLKTKEGAAFDLDLGYDAVNKTGHEATWDLSRKIIMQKSNYYRLLLTGNADTTETFCSILSITKDERETVGGAVLKTFLRGHYDSEENQRTTIGSMVIINGFILNNADSSPWNFSFTSGDIDNNGQPSRSVGNSYGSSRYVSGYLKNDRDSFQIRLVRSISTYKFLGKIDTLYFEEGFDLVNRSGAHLAAYQRKGKDKKSPYVWMQRDLDDSYQRAIASFMVLIIGR